MTRFLLWQHLCVIFCYNRKVLLKISKNEVTNLRVVAGDFGGRPLKTLEGKTTRPTTDKVKGAIFNMIGPFFDGGRVLDLFSGSGSSAIEAISRGMSSAVLVEKDRRAQAIIQENIKMTKSGEAVSAFEDGCNACIDTIDRSI